MRFLMTLCLAMLTACAGQPSSSGQPGGLAAAVAASLHRGVEDDAGRVLGSGTVLGPSLVLTNRHVVERRGTALAVRGPEGLAAVREVRLADAADLALLRLDSPMAVAATPILAPTVPARTPLAAAGLLDGALRVEAGWAMGAAAARSGCAAAGLARLPVSPGFSGGPVVTPEGHLAGIVAAAVVETEADARRLLAAGSERTAQLSLQTVLYVPAAILSAAPDLLGHAAPSATRRPGLAVVLPVAC